MIEECEECGFSLGFPVPSGRKCFNNHATASFLIDEFESVYAFLSALDDRRGLLHLSDCDTETQEEIILELVGILRKHNCCD